MISRENTVTQQHPIRCCACRVEDGLINHESPFCGSKKFGISHVNSEGGVSQVGTLLKIEGHQQLPDGQITTFNRGMQLLAQFCVQRMSSQLAPSML